VHRFGNHCKTFSDETGGAPFGVWFTKRAAFDFVFGGDSFSFQQGRDIGDIPNVAGHASGH